MQYNIESMQKHPKTAPVAKSAHQNAHLPTPQSVSLKQANEQSATHHPEKHWHRFSSDVACRMSLSTCSDTVSGSSVKSLPVPDVEKHA